MLPDRDAVRVGTERQVSGRCWVISKDSGRETFPLPRTRRRLAVADVPADRERPCAGG